jgi:hypothetical protein
MPEIGSEERADGPQYAESDLRIVPMKEAGPWTKDRPGHELPSHSPLIGGL